MKTYHTFKTRESFQKYLQTKHSKCDVAGKYGGCLDYVRVAGVLYTMHEYDHAGQYITWANKKHQMMMEERTRNRYAKDTNNSYADAIVEIYPSSYLRNDINYAQ